MAILKRKRLTKSTIEAARKYAGMDSIALECSKCHRVVEQLNADTASVICSYCVQLMVEPPTMKKASSGRSRGWQFKKEYQSPEGVLYSYGEPVDESNSEIKSNDMEIKNSSNSANKRRRTKK